MFKNRIERKPDFKRLKKVLLRDGEPDHLPFYELFADGSVVRAITGKLAGIEANVEFQYKMGYDYVYTGGKFSYPLRKINTVEDTASPGTGAKRGFADDNRGEIENRADFDAYPWPEISGDFMENIEEYTRLLPEGMKMLIGSIGIYESVTALMGHIPFSYALQDDEGLVSDMFEKIGTDAVRAMETVMDKADIRKLGAVVMGDDLGYSQGTMISPIMLRKYVFPWQKRIADIAHNHDLPFILHSCGNLEEVMDDLIGYVGIDAKHSFEDKILPVTEAKKRYGDKIAVLGGVDMNFLASARKEEVEPYVTKVMRACMPGGGYALGTGNSVANYIPVSNYLEMLRVGREKGSYL